MHIQFERFAGRAASCMAPTYMTTSNTNTSRRPCQNTLLVSLYTSELNIITAAEGYKHELHINAASTEFCRHPITVPQRQPSPGGPNVRDASRTQGTSLATSCKPSHSDGVGGIGRRPGNLFCLGKIFSRSTPHPSRL